MPASERRSKSLRVPLILREHAIITEPARHEGIRIEGLQPKEKE